MDSLTYHTLEKLKIEKPVDRIGFFVKNCRNKCVLDIGSYDETAYILKNNTKYWMFSRLEKVAKSLLGIDSALPADELEFKSAKIIKMDAANLKDLKNSSFDIITAGEFIEHIQFHLEFLMNLKVKFSGKELLISTPNGGSFANFLMALINREAQHKDHIHVFTFKTLNTVCKKAGFASWEIIPGYFSATEIKMQTKSKFKRFFIVLIEKFIRFVEWLYPLTSSTYIVKIKI